MFPTLYHFFKSTFGYAPDFLQVVNTFGFFVAISIAAAFWVMQNELARKTGLGYFSTVKVKETIGRPYPASDYLLNGILAFLFGYKVLFLATSAGDGFSPQEHIFTSEGNLLLGIACAAIVLGLRYYQDKKQRLPVPEVKETETDASWHMGNITTIALVAGFLGAKVFHILENPAELSVKKFVADFFSSGGWTFYGGLICGAAGVLWYCKRKGLNILHVLDAGGPAMMLSYGIGRFGCHFSGDGDWGIANTNPKPFSFLTDWAWAYTYPNNVLGMGNSAPEGMKQIAGQQGDFSYELIVPVYPTPLYEALMGVGLFLILWKVLRMRTHIPGNLFAWYMVFAGLERFGIESIREHGESLYRFGNATFSQAQMISVLLVLGGILWISFLSKKFIKPVA